MNVDALSTFVTKLNDIRKRYGDGPWREAILKFGVDCLNAGGQTEHFAKEMINGLASEGLSWEQVEAAAAKQAIPKNPAPTMDEMFMKALQQQLPGLKSQAQFTAFQGAFEAFRAVSNAILAKNKEGETSAKEALEKGFETLRMATDLTQKLEDVPEAATSAEAEEFKRPPAEFQEYDVQRSLLSELTKISTLSELNEWWKTNRQRVDQVKNPSLRNPLIDLVREKKAQLATTPQA
jgi:hypothetical protein